MSNERRDARRGARRVLLGFACAALIALGSPSLAARQIVPRASVLPDGPANLPVFLPGTDGQQWTIYPGGMLRQNGGIPLYGQAAMLTINGNQPQSLNAAARVEAGEVLLENMPAGQVSVTRRVRLTPDGLLRVIDVITNTAGTDLPVTVALQTNLNAGIAGANVVSDPAKKDAPLGWAALTGRGRAVAQVYAGKGGKVLPAIQAQPGNQFCQATYSFTIPAGQSAALWHLHGAAADLPAASKLVASVDEAKLLQAVAKEVRALIVNVRQGGGAAGAVELPRGGSLDVVELRNGDRLTGTIREPMYKLLAPYGTIELPPDRVLGLLNVGRFRPRQLLVTTDGQVLGGTLAKETLDVELSGGQVTPVPLRQVARTGYRGRSGDPDAGRASTGEPSAPRPTIFLRDGDRVAVGSFAEPVTLATRYGQLSVPPPAIASIAFVGDAAAAHGAHAVHLTDGSVLQAFVTAPALTAPLEVTGQTASFPLGDINRAILAPAPAEVDDGAVAVLRTTTGDTLVGTINGTLKLDTAFDTIALPANELRGLSRGVATDAEPGAGASDVQVTTWDGGTLSGRLQDAQLDVRLVCGVELKVSVSLLADYTQPAPQPSGQVLERIRAVVAELSADDWKQRDRAEAQLVGLGPSVGGVLRQLRATVPAEAQQRIDAVLQQLDAAKP